MSFTACTTVRQSTGEYERLPLKVVKSPTKEGKSCTHSSWFSLFNHIDLSVESARQNGNINEIVSIEKEVTTGLFYYQFCTVVRGN